MPAPLVSRSEDHLAAALERRGIRFTRQLELPSIGARPYVLDFAFPHIRLDVEIDGPHHDHPAQAEKDAHRDAWLRNHGWEVIRIPSEEAYHDPDATAERLIKVLRKRGAFSPFSWIGMLARRAWWSRVALLFIDAAILFTAWNALAWRESPVGRWVVAALCGVSVIISVRIGSLDRRYRRRRRRFGIAGDIASIFLMCAILFIGVAFLL